MKKTNLEIIRGATLAAASSHNSKIMKTLVGSLALQAVLILPAAAERKGQGEVPPPAQGKAGTELRVALDLVDGSHIIGSPRSKSLDLRTPYAEIAIPLKQIQFIKMGDDHETATFRMNNGDSLTGVLGDSPMKIRSIVGNLSLELELIRSLKVTRIARTAGKKKLMFEPVASGKITDKPYGHFAVADFNKDGLPDFSVSNKTKGSTSVDIYLNDGNGQMVLKQSHPVGWYPQDIQTGDFDEDGHVDLLVAIYGGGLGHGTMRLFRGSGDGSFDIGPGFSAKVNGKGLNPCRMDVADLNKDGHLDFVVEMNNDWALNVHWGDGKGHFTPKHSCSNGQNPGNTEIVDLNNDGWPDIVSGSQYTSLFVHLSDCAGGYAAPVQYLKGTSRRQPIVVGDLDDDGDADILVANSSARYASIMINDGEGGFVEKGRIDFPDGTGLAKLADFDGDGRTDCVLSSGGKVLVVSGKGDGTFHAPIAHDLGHKVGPLQLHDINSDGQLDLVYIDPDRHEVMMHLTVRQ